MSRKHSANHEMSSFVDFEDVYSWFGGTIYHGVDCGIRVCGTTECCHPHRESGQVSYIYYLPGEFEFLKRKLGSRFPAVEIEEGTAKYHCFGNVDKKCIYEYRPIDCRSYPYWPVVKDGTLLCFLDLRKPRCPIKKLPIVFFEDMKNHWLKLLRYRIISNWLENEAPKPSGIPIPINEKIEGT